MTKQELQTLERASTKLPSCDFGKVCFVKVKQVIFVNMASYNEQLAFKYMQNLMQTLTAQPQVQSELLLAISQCRVSTDLMLKLIKVVSVVVAADCFKNLLAKADTLHESQSIFEQWI